MTGGAERSKRPGRRPGTNETREAILAAARDAFAARGYEKATIRGIARQAGVDPALVHHFYGPKTEVFKAAVSDVLAPIANALEAAAPGDDPGATAERLGSALSSIWEREPTRGALLGALRSAVTSDTAAELLRGIVQEKAVAVVASTTGQPDAELRANLIGATMIGVAVARHVLGVQPIASLDVDEMDALLAGVVRHYLSDQLV
jgi:AcrR family transcriptional regulator